MFIDFLVDPKMKLLPEKIKGDMTKEEKETIQKNNAKKVAEREKKAAELKVKPEQLTKDLMRSFTEYLINRFTGEGAHTVYGRFKKMILAALDKDIIAKNPCTGVSIKKDYGQLKKDILSQEEITTLVATHYDKENPDIRRAFIFCLYCGLRWCDVKDLTYANVDYSNKLLKFEQSKTKAHSAASGVVIPLNDGLLHLIGQPKEDYLIAQFKDAYRNNATADLMLDFARKHMPDELAEIENGYNQIYEKRHQRIEERKAAIVAREKAAEETDGTASATTEETKPEETAA